MDNINIRVKTIRKDWQLTQKDFANRLGITNAHVSAIEKGKTVPSQALAKLICKEFKISECWLLEGKEPMYAEQLESKIDDIMQDVTNRLNKIRTRDDDTIRSRIIPIEKMFVDMLELPNATQEQKIQYYDLFFKLFYHLNTYLNFHKEEITTKQSNIFPFPDDLLENLTKDIANLETFFKKILNE